MRRYRLLLLLWLLSDLAVFVGAYGIAYFLRVGPILSTDFPFKEYILSAALAAPVTIAVLGTTRTFALGRSQATLRNAAYIAYSALVGTAFFTLGYYFLFESFFSRLLLGYAFVLSAMLLLLWHIVFQWILRAVLRRDPPAFPTLLVGVTRESRTLLETLRRSSNPLKPVAILDGRGVSEKEIVGVPVLGKLNKLEEVLAKRRITHLIQCSDMEQSLNLLSACRNLGITYIVLPSVFGIVERDESVESLEGTPVTVVRPKGGWLGWFVR